MVKTIICIILTQSLLVYVASPKPTSPGYIAKQKCTEYGKYVFKEEIDQSTMLMEVRTTTVSTCPIVEVPLIVGGVEASEKEFPHMALLGFGRNKNQNVLQWLCGGSLISTQFVLTAAHCFIESNTIGLLQRVRLGISKNNQLLPKNGIEIFIDKIISHPKYTTTQNYHDIGLIKLEKHIKPTEYVRPACISVANNKKYTKLIASGFGKTDVYSYNVSNSLFKVQLDSLETEFCDKIYKNDNLLKYGFDNSSQMCIGVLVGGSDTCQGDSGGPVQIVLKKPYCMYQVVGVTVMKRFPIGEPMRMA